MSAAIGTEATVSTVTRETCDRCGPAVAAEFIVHGNAGTLTFCGHCTRHGVARTLARWARPVPNMFDQEGAA